MSTISASPSIVLSPLSRTDGSATYSGNGYTIIAGINGPLEVTRRDEIPDEAALEVLVKPSSGVGSIRERHLETVLHRTLRNIILVTAHPRSLIQLTLQIITTPSSSRPTPSSASQISLLPALLQASVLALLEASIPLSTTLTSALVTMDATGNISIDPSSRALEEARSTHALAYSARGELLLVESEGVFTFGEFEEVESKGRLRCLGTESRADDGDVNMQEDHIGSLQDVLKDAMAEKFVAKERWKTAV